jgi:hypothetical protein
MALRNRSSDSIHTHTHTHTHTHNFFQEWKLRPMLLARLLRGPKLSGPRCPAPGQNSAIQITASLTELPSYLGRGFLVVAYPSKALGQFVLNSAKNRYTGVWEKDDPRIQDSFCFFHFSGGHCLSHLQTQLLPCLLAVV